MDVWAERLAITGRRTLRRKDTMETGDGQTLKQAVSNALEKTHKGSADYPFRVELATSQPVKMVYDR